MYVEQPSAAYQQQAYACSYALPPLPPAYSVVTVATPIKTEYVLYQTTNASGVRPYHHVVRHRTVVASRPRPHHVHHYVAYRGSSSSRSMYKTTVGYRTVYETTYSPVYTNGNGMQGYGYQSAMTQGYQLNGMSAYPQGPAAYQYQQQPGMAAYQQNGMQGYPAPPAYQQQYQAPGMLAYPPNAGTY